MTGNEAGGGGVADLEEGRDEGTDGAAVCGAGISSGSAVRTGAISGLEARASSVMTADDVWLG